MRDPQQSERLVFNAARVLIIKNVRDIYIHNHARKDMGRLTDGLYYWAFFNNFLPKCLGRIISPWNSNPKPRHGSIGLVINADKATAKECCALQLDWKDLDEGSFHIIMPSS